MITLSDSDRKRKEVEKPIYVKQPDKRRTYRVNFTRTPLGNEAILYVHLFLWFYIPIDRSYYDRDPESGTYRLSWSATRGNAEDLAHQMIESYERNTFGQQL